MDPNETACLLAIQICPICLLYIEQSAPPPLPFSFLYIFKYMYGMDQYKDSHLQVPVAMISINIIKLYIGKHFGNLGVNEENFTIGLWLEFLTLPTWVKLGWYYLDAEQVFQLSVGVSFLASVLPSPCILFLPFSCGCFFKRFCIFLRYSGKPLIWDSDLHIHLLL